MLLGAGGFAFRSQDSTTIYMSVTSGYLIDNKICTKIVQVREC
jgi:hypothetical protein